MHLAKDGADGTGSVGGYGRLVLSTSPNPVADDRSSPVVARYLLKKKKKKKNMNRRLKRSAEQILVRGCSLSGLRRHGRPKTTEHQPNTP